MSDETGASILETESYVIALVFLAFLALFITFEKVRKMIALAVGVDAYRFARAVLVRL